MSEDDTSPGGSADSTSAVRAGETADGGGEDSQQTEPIGDDASIDNKETTRADTGSSEPEQHLEKRAERLDQRELGLDKRAEDLEARAAELDDREMDLEERAAELDEYQTELQDREDRIAERESELDEREATIEDQEQALRERAEELDRKEQTLRNYVGEQLTDVEDSFGETIQDAVSSALVHYDNDDARVGSPTALLIGLAGLVLLAGGVANGAAELAGGSTTLLSSGTSNLAVSAVLVVGGLGTNLVAVTNRL